MKTGYVILNYNCWQETERLAGEVASFDEIDAVVVIDNASTDDSYEHLRQIRQNKIYVRRTGKNGGFSYGNNYGAKVCGELGMEILFISNPDVHVEEAAIKKIKERFGDRDYAVLSGVEYGPDGNPVWPPLHKRREYWDDFVDCFFLGRKCGGKRFGIALDREAVVQEAEMVKGAFFAVRLEDFLKAGGLDEQVFLYCEERILSRRMEGIGKKTGIVTGAGYVHTHSATICRSYQKVSRRIRILYAARLYYNKQYNRIGIVKTLLLLAAMKFSVFEYSIRDTLCCVDRKTASLGQRGQNG